MIWTQQNTVRFATIQLNWKTALEIRPIPYNGKVNYKISQLVKSQLPKRIASVRKFLVAVYTRHAMLVAWQTKVVEFFTASSILVQSLFDKNNQFV